ncbi:DUF1471 domain-containing protein [Gilliamella sp. B2894]|uniref:YdgH/BhsA/McbA-like domain containing protein n=1 Tax=unclassified Gilliamella TaxID=2685620 RepID=UPI00226A30FA|nr:MULTISPECIES: YdgH/BhsA/McbA-like domain containing protein [unclassified Gilliamella]MCX8657276.1 DUF1471 domain-containing protein [Gilliamella sp. B2894]MCX8693515.1 DUF1471 domain-containing protein [Gilliamella sp. B2881]MCX8697194.1 DUF1471 domain-containing protein [Gilliamella sp. B2828]
MISFKKTLIVAAIVACPMSSFAAQQLNEEQAKNLQSFKQITVRGAFYTDNDYVIAMSKAADKEGASAFYITTTNISPSNDTLRIVYAKLYKSNAPKATETTESFRKFEGVYEYPKSKAIRLEPFNIVRIRGYFPSEIDVNQAVAKEALVKGAYAFYIDSRSELGSNIQVAAYLFKKDAPERKLQPENAIPYDSEAGQIALAQGGETAMQVEKPGYYSPSAFNEKFYANKFNNKVKVIDQSTTKITQTKVPVTVNPEVEAEPQRVKRYTVTLPDGRKIQELNDATAAKMVAFDTIKFRGYYVTDQEISYQAGKKAIENGAKFYHIARIAHDAKGPNITVFIDLYK